MRLHWLPSTVHPTAICNVLERFGKLIEISEELYNSWSFRLNRESEGRKNVYPIKSGLITEPAY